MTFLPSAKGIGTLEIFCCHLTEAGQGPGYQGRRQPGARAGNNPSGFLALDRSAQLSMGSERFSQQLVRLCAESAFRAELKPT